MKKRVLIPLITTLCMLLSACAIVKTPDVATTTPIVPQDNVISLSDFAELLEYNDREAQYARYEALNTLFYSRYYVEDGKCIYVSPTTDASDKQLYSYIHTHCGVGHPSIGADLFYILECTDYPNGSLFDTKVSIYDLASIYGVKRSAFSPEEKWPNRSDYETDEEYNMAYDDFVSAYDRDTDGTIAYYKHVYSLAKAEFGWEEEYSKAMPIGDDEFQQMYYAPAAYFELRLTVSEIYALVQREVFVGLSQRLNASYTDTIDPELLMLMDLEDKTGITTYEVFVYLDISARDKDIEAIMSEAGIGKSSWYQSYLDIPYFAPLSVRGVNGQTYKEIPPANVGDNFQGGRGSITARLTKEQIYALASNEAVGVIRPNMADKTLNSYSGDFDYIKESKIPAYLSESFISIYGYESGRSFSGDAPPEYHK